jgi:all-trans-8'-apo-beta-carotenal 15,15'-oxygenase
VAFAFNTGASCSVTFYEFDEAGTRRESLTYTLPDTIVTIIHDIAVTENYYIIVEGPVQFSVQKFLREYLLSRCSVAECLVYEPSEQTRVHVIPRHKGQAGEWVWLGRDGGFERKHVCCCDVQGSGGELHFEP